MTCVYSFEVLLHCPLFPINFFSVSNANIQKSTGICIATQFISSIKFWYLHNIQIVLNLQSVAWFKVMTDHPKFYLQPGFKVLRAAFLSMVMRLHFGCSASVPHLRPFAATHVSYDCNLLCGIYLQCSAKAPPSKPLVCLRLWGFT